MLAIEPIISRALGIDAAAVTDGLRYQSIPEWDSLGHLALMVELESAIGTQVPEECVVELDSIRAIRDFVRSTMREDDAAASGGEDAGSAVGEPEQPERDAPEIHRGLAGVYMDSSEVTNMDGQRGVLEYRGYSIHDLVAHSSFEDTAYLLIYGQTPTTAERAGFTRDLHHLRALPPTIVEVLRLLRDAHPIEALRTGVSALGALDADGRDESYESAEQAGLRLIAQIPTIIATHHAIRRGREPVAPPADGRHAHAVLSMLLDQPPSTTAERFVDRDLIIHADHASNASTFTARIAIGCHANLHAAVTAAIASFSGSLHGGAAQRVTELIDDVGSPGDAAAYVRDRMARREPVMGFGHRVYRTEDPRVRHLRAIAQELAIERSDTEGFEILEQLVAAMEPYVRHGVAPNVDLYAGLAYRLLGLPDDLSVPMFVAGRIAGWVAQALEQKRNNVLIRPLLRYVGPPSRQLLPACAA